MHYATYSAKQAGEIWGSLLDQSLKSWGFQSSKYDNRIYFFKLDSEFIIIAIVVDDLAFASNSPSLLQHLKNSLVVHFDVKLFGQLSCFVGWNISKSTEGISIDQRGYIKTMFKEYGIERANGVATPFPRDADVTSAHSDYETLNNKEHKLYRSIIGSLLYLSICSRPDVSFSVAVL